MPSHMVLIPEREMLPVLSRPEVFRSSFSSPRCASKQEQQGSSLSHLPWSYLCLVVYTVLSLSCLCLVTQCRVAMSALIHSPVLFVQYYYYFGCIFAGFWAASAVFSIKKFLFLVLKVEPLHCLVLSSISHYPTQLS